jgi:SAM-dependent methyltransferase
VDDDATSAPDEAAALHGLRRRIEAYYSRKIVWHGSIPAGVDWASAAAQRMRFSQLLKLCDFAAPFSLNDLGCGYGALLTHLAQHHTAGAVDYLGIDLSPAMIWHARRLPSCSDPQWFVDGHRIPRVADYTVASGIFNVRLSESVALWRRFIRCTLRQMGAASRKGFAANFMSRAEAGRGVRRGLYVCSPEIWTSWCERTLHASVEVLSGYGLPEFTLLVRHGAERGAD